jgi:hypothetical protein
MRISVDGNQILNRWYDQPAYIYLVQVNLTQGVHRISVDYYHNNGWATASLTWQNNSPSVQVPVILSLTASPAAIAAGQSATLGWSLNNASSINIDNGVGDVTGITSVTVSPGQTTTYTLTASNSAGSATAQATVTVETLQDTQPPSTPTLSSANANGLSEVDLSWTAATDNIGVAGYQIFRNGSVLTSVSGSSLIYADKSAAANTTYTYAVKAFDAAGNYSGLSNSIQITMPSGTPTGGSCGSPGSGVFTGCYFSNTSLSGNPTVTRLDPQINFDWGSGSPDPSLTPSNFSVRWQGYFTLDEGTYSFVTSASDGVRLYIDGRLWIDQWKDQPSSIYQARPSLTQGTHLITLEYYAHTGWASAHLSWQKY